MYFYMFDIYRKIFFKVEVIFWRVILNCNAMYLYNNGTSGEISSGVEKQNKTENST